jgi:chaperone required for assembly of F1-ATPase
VKPDGRDPSEVLLRKRQDKYYDPLIKWFEEVCVVGPPARGVGASCGSTFLGVARSTLAAR